MVEIQEKAKLKDVSAINKSMKDSRNIIGTHDTLGEHPIVSPPGWDLPGKGEKGLGCGQDVGKLCDCCGWYFQVEKQCNQKTCPSCWRRWAFLGGKRAGLRTWAAWRKALGNQWRRSRLMHIVVSLKYEGGELDEYKKRTYKVCKEHGIDGGAVICHHTRDRHDNGRVPDGYIHYHIIGVARRGIKPGKDKTEIFHVIRDKHNGYRGFKRTSEVVRCIQYLLTHAAVKKGKHTLSYFGCISNNKVPNRELPQELVQYMKSAGRTKCPSCGSTEIGTAWDVDAMVNYKAKNEAFYTREPAYALEKYGIICD